MNGYGAANYGINIYGQAAYVDAASSINAVSSLTANAQRVAQGASSINAASTLTAAGVMDCSQSVSINAASTLTANSNATMSGVVIIGMVSGMTALGRLKYEPEPVDSADWDALPTSSTSWVDL